MVTALCGPPMVSSHSIEGMLALDISKYNPIYRLFDKQSVPGAGALNK